MRVTTALDRLLALRGASVTGVRLTAEGVIVRVRLRRRRIACSVCGQAYTGMHDRQWRRWRHLDLAGHGCFVEYELRWVDCRDCGVRVEAVPWARRGARHTGTNRLLYRVYVLEERSSPSSTSAAPASPSLHP